jgi:Leucine-rich repeat (LRR) protein
MYFLPRAGPIPTSLVVSSIHAFTFLVHLTELSVPYNQLSGVIPSAIGNLANLLVVDMESNQLRQVNEQGHHTIIATPPPTHL